MSTQTTTYSTPGTNTYTAPALLLNGSVQATVAGAAGGNSSPAGPGSPGGAPGATGGKGGQVVGTVPVAAGRTLTAVVGAQAGAGEHAGGTGAASVAPSSAGGHGGGSSAVLSGATPLVEAGGGGGAGGASGTATGGAGGKGGLSPSNGANGPTGAYNGTSGAGGGGGGHQGAGSNAPHATSDGNGGIAPGGAGDSGASPGTGPAGGGAGGKSYADPSVGSPVFTDGNRAGNGIIILVATVADPPYVPTLTAPGAGAYLDSFAAGVTFSWTYNPGTDSGVQNAYVLRVLISGVYKYWNATSGLFQGSIVWNSSALHTVTVPAGILPDGVSYNWSVATQEAHYNLQSPFASDSVFTASAQPTVTVTGPSGTISTAQPAVTWTEILGGGLSQTSFRVVVYTQAVTLQPGFSPGVTTATVDSGVISTAALSWPIPTALAQGNWVAYVQIVETGAVSSAWASSAFTITYPGPATPTLTATPGTAATGAPIVTLLVTAHDNLLSTDDASFEGSVGTWQPGANTTIAQSSTQALDGSESMKLTAAALGTISAEVATGAYPITGGVSYAAVAALRSAATARSCTIGIAWYNNAGALISTSTGTPVNDTTSGWTQATAVGVAPGTAVYAAPIVTIASEVASGAHYVDEAGLFAAAAAPAWTRGGLVPLDTVSIVSSDDGGATWQAVRDGTGIPVPSITQQVTIVDPEPLFGVPRLYSATISANVTTPVVATVTSTPATATATVTSTNWWLTDPQDPTTALALHRAGTVAASLSTIQSPISFQKTRTESMGVFYAFGRPNAIVQRGTVQSPSFTLNALIEGAAEAATFLSLCDRQATLLLRSDMGDGWYIAIGPDLPESILRATDRIANPWALASVACTVTDRP
ncbi:MAG TPA: hypothetical protein VHT75_04385 [Acidimicrobiales bacterium]|jgi:hypothetical protein|nr:hypothetical protein [Acidimicrobiales bacterium]